MKNKNKNIHILKYIILPFQIYDYLQEFIILKNINGFGNLIFYKIFSHNIIKKNIYRFYFIA